MNCLVILTIWMGCATTAGAVGSDALAENYEANHGRSGQENNHTVPTVPSTDELLNIEVSNGKRHATLRLHRPKRNTDECDNTAIYRTTDGRCNNLNNPDWGSANQVFLRLQDPVYDDGLGVPRLNGVNGSPLPSPRTVSTTVHDFDRQRLSGRATAMAMEWGQFLSHDITGTPVDKDSMTTATCCSADLISSGSQHSDVSSGGPCFPFLIGTNDRHFVDQAYRCMEFVRSLPITDANGVRQQMNQLSAYIDGTGVYGGNDDDMARLRDTSGGKLKVTSDNQLPESSTFSCIKDGDDYCLDAGDSRVNVYPPLGLMHTTFVRYHNYIAGQLGSLNPGWSHDQLFNVTRKIVIAVLQSITYQEYLPMVIGRTNMAKYGVNTPYAYNDSCDATLYNVFSTAAMRFGHSMVPDALLINGVNVSSIDLFKRPHHVLQSSLSLLDGLVKNQAENVDRWYSLGMTDHLFEEKEYEGQDIASLNIQRGRDHGIGSYNTWRNLCGLPSIISFDQLPNHAVNRFTSVYGNTDDIDLYSGALTEGGDGGLVGATYSCILGKQFAKLRSCDRFWYETTDTSIGFTDKQRKQIKGTKLSHVLCLTYGLITIQESVFRYNTAEKSCSDLLGKQLDLSTF